MKSALMKYVEKRRKMGGCTYADVGRELGVTASYVGMLARGECVPRLKLARAIEKWSSGQVPVTSWP